jgi:hypothetical protein
MPNKSDLSTTVYTAAPLTLTITSPLPGTAGSSSEFTATTNVTASFPITFVWSITPTGFSTHAALYRSTDTISYTWNDLGSQTVTATVANALGTLTATRPISFGLILFSPLATGPRDSHIYLPLIQRW